MIKSIKDLEFGGKMYIILVYDIKQVDNFARVQRYVYKICKRYLVHVQNSVFEGEITVSNLIKLKEELKRYLRCDLDSCIIFKSRNKKWLDKEFVSTEMEDNIQFI